MAQLTQLDVQLVGIGQVIRSAPMCVPVYQRSYAWEAQHVEDLLDDISTAISRSESEYFLGSIVLAQESDDPEVVDGQQRLATATIFVAAVRDHFLSEEDETRANELTIRYLASRDLRTEELQTRLTLNQVDHDFFLDHIIKSKEEREGLEPLRQSHRRIKQAAELAAKHVAAIAKTSGKASTERLVDWIDYLDKNAKVIRVQVPDHANAFIIFETLNDRGLALAISDLLKNYLFSCAKARLNEVMSSWTTMTGILESVGEDNVVVDFIRQLWSSKNGLTRERELYKTIRKKVNNTTKSVEFTRDLEQHARTYVAILNSDHVFWKKYGENARGYVATLNLLRMEQIRPLLLAILANFKQPQVVKALRLLVSCVVRVLIVGSRGGTLEKQYADTAKAVSDGTITNEKQLRAALEKLVPANSEFLKAFAVATVSKNYLARYYLRAIEQYSTPKLPEWVPSESTDDVTLEHVVPKTLSDDWSAFDEDTHRSYLKRIGNLAIMSATDNSTSGNEKFSTKKKAYRKSSFQSTKMIASQAIWTPTEIESRQEHLAALAVKTWPLSGDTRKPAVKKKSVKKKAAKKKTARKK